MSRSKIAISLDESTLERLDKLVRKQVSRSRSQAIQEALEGKLARLEWSRLARECSKLDPNQVRGQERAGPRPVLILSQDVFNERSGTVIAVALASEPRRAGFPLALELQSKGLQEKPWAKISQIRTLPMERIGGKLARATPEELALVVGGLKEIVGA